MADLGQYTAIPAVDAPPLVAWGYKGAFNYQLKGILKVVGTPSVRRVVVLDRHTMSYVRSGMTKPDGTFHMKHLPEQAFADHYIVLAFDDMSRYNAEVIDLVKQRAVVEV